MNLLRALYHEQTGHLADGSSFNISRGVRQGDVLSPVLFNAALERALAVWKASLDDHGIAFDSAGMGERLTNIRYADDLLLFATSWAEAEDMLVSLSSVFASYGLELNAKKTKVFSTQAPPEVPTLIETPVGFVEHVHTGTSHKYLGRAFSGDLWQRAKTAAEHRIGCAWLKCRALQSTLTNKHINVMLRLRLFDAVVTPTLLYSLETVSMTQGQLDRLDCVQRTMLRRIVGWVCYSEDDTWEQRGRRMKARLARALELQPVLAWSDCVGQRKKRIQETLQELTPLTHRAMHWDVVACAHLNLASVPRRARGRPRARWADLL